MGRTGGREYLGLGSLSHHRDCVKCFGKAEGVPISPIDSILADSKGGFWLGGQTALVHWRDGASETYPIEALKSNVGQHGVVSVALGPDGTVWVGMLAEGPGLGLGRLKEGVVKPFVTPTFDGSKVEVFAMTFDRDGNLWVASRGKGLYRIHGDVADHYGRSDGLSSDAVNLLFEDREGILWAGTSNGIDSFRDPRVTTFSSSEGLGKDAAAGLLASRDGSIWIANDGSLDRIANGSISSIRTGAGLPGHQAGSLLEDRAGNLWVGVDDSLYVLKDGRFRRIAGPDHKPLGLVVGLTEDIDGNIWAACAGNPRKLVRIRDFEVREEFADVAGSGGPRPRSGSAGRDLDSNRNRRPCALAQWRCREVRAEPQGQSVPPPDCRRGRRLRARRLGRRARRTAAGQSAAHDD